MVKVIPAAVVVLDMVADIIGCRSVIAARLARGHTRIACRVVRESSDVTPKCAVQGLTAERSGCCIINCIVGIFV